MVPSLATNYTFSLTWPMNDLTHDIEETETFHIFNLIFIDITD